MQESAARHAGLAPILFKDEFSKARGPRAGPIMSVGRA